MRSVRNNRSRPRTQSLTYSQPMRGAIATSSPLHWLTYSPLGGFSSFSSDSWLSQVEDRRYFSPAPLGGQPYTPARTLFGPPARFKVAQQPRRSVTPNYLRLSPRVAFQAPARAIICVRRNQRREVMHALGLAGRSGRTGRQRRSPYSHITCGG